MPSVNFMKEPIKNSICRALKCSGVSWCYEKAQAIRGNSPLSILLFHRVTDEVPEDGLTVSTGRFESLCGMLARKFNVISLTEASGLVTSGKTIPPRTAAITFDDGYRDNLDAALILRRFRLPACFFVTVGYVGTKRAFPWDNPKQPLPILNWDELRDLERMGFEIGSHTLTHPDLGTATPETIRQELSESKRILDKRLRKPVRWFAYPYGGPEHFNQNGAVAAGDAGYDGCFSGHGGYVFHGNRAFVLPRIPIAPKNNLRLEAELSGSLRWAKSLRRRLPIFRGEPDPVVERQVKDHRKIAMAQAQVSFGQARR